jgi:hypothetical protein
MVMTANIPTTAPMTIQLVAGVMFPFAKPLTTSLGIGYVPPSPRIQIMTPWNPSNPASVTTNDGNPSRVMSVPWNRPMAVVTSRAARIAAHHGQSYGPISSLVVTTPPMPETNPIDRSISPSSRANTSPMPSSMNAAPCVSRFTRLPAVRKFSFWDWKMIAIRSRPTTTGRTPLSPARARASRARQYSESDPAASSGAATASAA